ncbi:tetratricopeptide repeat protein [Pirellulaceae bacterium SH501]
MGSRIRQIVENTRWLGSEFLKIFTSPVGMAGSVLDAARGWKYSRNWLRFWFHLPAFLIVLIVYLIFGFSLFERVDAKVQRYGVEGEKTLPTRMIERSAYNQFRFMNPKDPKQAATLTDPNAIPDFAKNYSRLLANRILTFQPNNAQARYRLALLQSIDGDMEGAKLVIEDLASGKYGPFRQANAWMACWIIQAKEDQQEIDTKELGRNLQMACDWVDVPVQLIAIYAQILEQNGYTPSAIAMAKEAAKRLPEMNLELARLYGRIKNEDGLREASYEVEEVFGARLNTSNERDIDRLAIAEVRFLTGKYQQAVAILQEGLAGNDVRPQLARALSSIKISIFEKSIVENPDGTFTADLSLLESAADADPDDPKISEQIAKLLRRNIKPTKRIVDILRKQIDDGITTAEAHSMLADGYYMLGNEKEAIKNWELALSKNPKDASACNNLALCLAKSSTDNLPQSLELVARAQSIAPNNAEILDTFGEILMMAGRAKEAINKFEQSIKLDSGRIGTRKKLVTAYEAAGLPELAKAQSEIVQSMENESK